MIPRGLRIAALLLPNSKLICHVDSSRAAPSTEQPQATLVRSSRCCSFVALCAPDLFCKGDCYHKG